MEKDVNRRLMGILAVGDLIVIALITLVGFASHGALGSAGLRMLTTFTPLALGWLAAAPALGAYRMENVARMNQLWRPVWGMALGAPMAAWLRGVWLNAAIQPVFVGVLVGVSMTAILIWRIVFYFLLQSWRKS